MKNISIKIKQFLKPNWRKVFILIIVSIFLVLLVVLLRLIYGQFPDLPIGFESIKVILYFLIMSPSSLLYMLLTDEYLHFPRFYGFLISGLGILAWYFIICLATHFYDKFRPPKKETSEKIMKKMTIATILIIVATMGAGKLIWIFEARECIAQKLPECQQLCVYDSTFITGEKYRLEGIEKFSGYLISGKGSCIDLCLNHYFQKQQTSKFPTTSKVLKMFGIRSYDLISSPIFNSQKKKAKVSKEEIKETAPESEAVIPEELIGLEKCAKIEYKYDKFECYKQIARNKQDSTICSKIEYPKYQRQRDECYVDIAIDKQNTIICKEIRDSIYRNWCSKTIQKQVLTPEEVAYGFFHWYMYNNTRSLGESADVTEEYKQKIARIREEMTGPGYDPVIFAQNIPEEFTIEKAGIVGKTASLIVNLEFASPRILKVELLLVDGKWKINGIYRIK